MNLLQLGSIKPPILFFGGPYSNLQSLQALYQKAYEMDIPPDKVIGTGDTVAYCAEPKKTISFLREWGVPCIAGNVEIQLSNDSEHCGCNFNEGSVCDRLSKDWYSYLQRHIEKEELSWMRSLPQWIDLEIEGYRTRVVHGSYSETSRFIYPSTSWDEKQKEMEKAKADIIIAGHSGIPFSHIANGKAWLNSGVTGMPANDGTPRGWFLLITTENDKLCFEHWPLHYDHKKASEQMKKEDLCPEYANTLLTGIWPSHDILPFEERAQEGIALNPTSHFLKI